MAIKESCGPGRTEGARDSMMAGFDKRLVPRFLRGLGYAVLCLPLTIIEYFTEKAD